MSNTVFNQHSLPWGPQQLGFTAGASIAQYGCLLTCFAMASCDRNAPITPEVLNNLFKQKNTFVQGDLLPSNALTLINPARWKTEVYRYKDVPADLSKLNIKPGQILVLEVDFDHNPNDGIQTHFVESIGWPMVKDPWFGDWVNFSVHYGANPSQTIQQIIVLTPLNPVVAPPVVVDPRDAQIASLTAQVAQLNSDKTGLLTTISGLLGKIAAAKSALG